MQLSDLLVLGLVTSVIYFSLWFLLGLYLKRFDFIDSAWGGGFIVIAVATIGFLDHDLYFVQKLVLLLVCLWGLRLMWHILMRNLKKKEDDRYVAMHAKYKKFKNLSIYVRIYLVQALLCWVIALPIIAVAGADDPFNSQLLLGIGFVVWAIGFAFEVFADRQLKAFISNPKNKGKIMTEGVWKYSRHPNYFGEVTLWWGIWLISMSLQPVWWSVIGPLTISYLILFVSGVPMLERKYADNKQFIEYAKRTSIFVPWFSKKL